MDRGNTKREILEASLNLFSVQGFEATSISQIASAVGIRKASLYSHFENKQAILDALVKDILEQYAEHSIFAKANWEKYEAPADQVMVLHTLVVHPAWAGRGCGGRFVEFYERYALEHGCRYLRMDTNEMNANARRLYGKLGYREAGMVSCVFNGIPDVHLVCLEKRL